MGRILDAFTEAATTIEDDELLQRRRAAVIADNQLRVVNTGTTAFVTARDTIIGRLAGRTGLPESDPRLHLGVSLALFTMAQAYVRWAGGETEVTLVEEFEGTVGLLRRLIADEVTFDPAPG